jgi:hypothetical protein
MKYRVWIYEVNRVPIEVEASSVEDAFEKAQDAYAGCEMEYEKMECVDTFETSRWTYEEVE